MKRMRMSNIKGSSSGSLGKELPATQRLLQREGFFLLLEREREIKVEGLKGKEEAFAWKFCMKENSNLKFI